MRVTCTQCGDTRTVSATRGKGTVMVACACVGRALLNLSAALLALGFTPEQVERAAKGDPS